MRSALVSSGSHLAADDRETRRVAQVVTHFCVATLILGTSYILLAWSVPALHLRGDPIILLSSLPYLVPLLLLRLRQTKLSGYVAWLFTWLTITAMAYTNGGLLAPVVAHYLMLMLTTALLSQGRTLWLAFAVGFISILGLGLLGESGLLPKPVAPPSHVARMVSLLMALVWLTVMLRTTLLQLGQALARAEREIEARRKSEAELRKTESDLRALNEQLEARVSDRTAELLSAKEAAQAASLAKSTFLATMSHELRTPVAGVAGLVELLGTCELPEAARAMMGPLVSSSKTLLSLIGDVLDYSKIEAGRLDIERIAMSPRAVLHDVMLLFYPKAKQQGLKLELFIDDSVPLYVSSDPTRIQQIVLNLVGNAIKFTPQGSVTVRLSHGDDLLRLSVTDTGIGIAQDSQEQLFQPFVQGDRSMTRRYGGSGLGLVITRQLATLLGGEIYVESQLGVGSTFTCTLRAPAADAPAAPSEYSPTNQPPLRILLAEDNDINAFIVGKLLSQLGHSCDRVRDGSQAVEYAALRPYDAIIMDMHMPVLDGPGATQRIRRMTGQTKYVPIIGLSADAIAEHEATYRSMGLSAYLTKPCTLAQLQQVLADVKPPGMRHMQSA